MAKKGGNRKQPSPVNEDQEPFDVKNILELTVKGKPKAQKQDDVGSDGTTIQVEEIIIQPRGFPMRIAGAESSLNLVVDDEELFEKYVVDQWSTLEVDVGTYLFDSYLFPEYAFQVVGVRPGPGKIGSDTKITVQYPATPGIELPMAKLSDVIGQSEAKRKCRIILKYLEDPEPFGQDWAPRNVLFHGPPGTGKTMLARALANEAEASFISRNATTLIGVHVGDGAKKIHELYDLAKKMAPVIVFIDELDAVGLSRSFQHVRGDVIEVSTALLSEMDGMAPNAGVVTIGATNQAELLDDALRSRFEEEICFTIPSLEDRIALLELYLNKTPFKLRVDVDAVARRINEWTGRDIKERLVKNLVHDLILAGKQVITTEQVMNMVTRLEKKKTKGINPLSF